MVCPMPFPFCLSFAIDCLFDPERRFIGIVNTGLFILHLFVEGNADPFSVVWVLARRCFV